MANTRSRARLETVARVVMRFLISHVRVCARWAGITSTAKHKTKKFADHLATGVHLHFVMLFPCPRVRACSDSSEYEAHAGLEHFCFPTDFKEAGASNFGLGSSAIFL